MQKVLLAAAAFMAVAGYSSGDTLPSAIPQNLNSAIMQPKGLAVYSSSVLQEGLKAPKSADPAVSGKTAVPPTALTPEPASFTLLGGALLGIGLLRRKKA